MQIVRVSLRADHTNTIPTPYQLPVQLSAPEGGREGGYQDCVPHGGRTPVGGREDTRRLPPCASRKGGQGGRELGGGSVDSLPSALPPCQVTVAQPPPSSAFLPSRSQESVCPDQSAGPAGPVCRPAGPVCGPGGPVCHRSGSEDPPEPAGAGREGRGQWHCLGEGRHCLAEYSSGLHGSTRESCNVGEGLNLAWLSGCIMLTCSNPALVVRLRHLTMFKSGHGCQAVSSDHVQI